MKRYKLGASLALILLLSGAAAYGIGTPGYSVASVYTNGLLEPLDKAFKPKEDGRNKVKEEDNVKPKNPSVANKPDKGTNGNEAGGKGSNEDGSPAKNASPADPEDKGKGSEGANGGNPEAKPPREDDKTAKPKNEQQDDPNANGASADPKSPVDGGGASEVDAKDKNNGGVSDDDQLPKDDPQASSNDNSNANDPRNVTPPDESRDDKNNPSNSDPKDVNDDPEASAAKPKDNDGGSNKPDDEASGNNPRDDADAKGNLPSAKPKDNDGGNKADEHAPGNNPKDTPDAKDKPHSPEPDDKGGVSLDKKDDNTDDLEEPDDDEEDDDEQEDTIPAEQPGNPKVEDPAENQGRGTDKDAEKIWDPGDKRAAIKDNPYYESLYPRDTLGEEWSDYLLDPAVKLDEWKKNEESMLNERWDSESKTSEFQRLIDELRRDPTRKTGEKLRDLCKAYYKRKDGVNLQNERSDVWYFCRVQLMV